LATSTHSPPSAARTEIGADKGAASPRDAGKPPRQAGGLALSVVVPASNRPATLERCVAAIERALAPGDELIVVGEPAELGVCAARNLGAARAGGGALVFVDADVEIHPTALVRLRSALERDSGLAAVFGCYDSAPEHRGTVSRFRNLLHHHVHSSAAGEASTFWAGLGAIRRAVFDEVGGFDAVRFTRPSIEDIELGMRLRDRGHRIALDPGVQGKHLKAWTLTRMIDTDLNGRAVPWLRLMIARRQLGTELNLGWTHRASALLSVGGLAALAARRGSLASANAVGLVALNADLYRLLARRGGVRLALAGPALHVLHHLTAAVAVPIAIVQSLLGRSR
jgi:hypothetical protein